MRPEVQVEVEVEIQVQTHVPTRVATQVATRVSILSDEHRDILRETRPIFDFGFWIDDWRAADRSLRNLRNLRMALSDRRPAIVTPRPGPRTLPRIAT